MLQEIVHFRLKGRIGFRSIIGLFDLENQRHQGLGDEPSTEHTEMAALIRSGPVRIQAFHGRVYNEGQRLVKAKRRVFPA